MTGSYVLVSLAMVLISFGLIHRRSALLHINETAGAPDNKKTIGWLWAIIVTGISIGFVALVFKLQVTQEQLDEVGLLSSTEVYNIDFQFAFTCLVAALFGFAIVFKQRDFYLFLVFFSGLGLVASAADYWGLDLGIDPTNLLPIIATYSKWVLAISSGVALFTGLLTAKKASLVWFIPVVCLVTAIAWMWRAGLLSLTHEAATHLGGYQYFVLAGVWGSFHTMLAGLFVLSAPLCLLTLDRVGNAHLKGSDLHVQTL